jgi:glutamine amidotransferase
MGTGNISAISQCYKLLGISFKIITKPSDAVNIDRYILPGVGHYCRTIKELRNSGLHDLLLEETQIKEKYLLGICVGMQILSDYGEEGDCNGLSIIPGQVKQIASSSIKLRLPHMGWNSIEFQNDHSGLFNKINPEIGFYFLHSYAFYPDDSSSIIASTEYGKKVPCVVSNNKNIFGVQFHPEKSHGNGLKMLLNYARF